MKALFVGTFLLLLFVPAVLAEQDSGYNIQTTSSGKTSDLQLSLADYVQLHSGEWRITSVERIGKFSGQAEGTYIKNGIEYAVQQYSMQEKLVEPAGGTFRAVNKEDLDGYTVENDIRIRRANDGSVVRYCVQHLTKSGSPDIIVTTYTDGLTALAKCSMAGRPEMDFALVSYANTNGLDTTVSHLNAEVNDDIRGRQYFKYHLNEKVSVATRL